MTFGEKLYSIFAILFALFLIGGLYYFDWLRELSILIPISFLGLLINVGFMYVVLRDILQRQFTSGNRRWIWLATILLFWPAVFYYLPKHGFKSRQISKTA